MGIVATSLVLSHIYNGTSIKSDASSYWNYLQSAPDISSSKLSLSKNNLTTYVANGVQRTQSTTLSAISENGTTGSLSLSLPTGVKLVNESTGKTYTGSATISNGQKFYLTASLAYDKKFDTGNISGNNIFRFQPIIFITASNSLQDMSGGRWISDPNPSVRITADFEAHLGDISLTKTLNRSDSSKASVAGATYGLYARSDILNGSGNIAYKTGTLIGTKTTNSQGKLNFTSLFEGSYYIKEITAPVYTSLDSTHYNVTLSGTGSMSASVTTQNAVLTRDISFAKVDTDGNMIPGATMQLRDSAGKLIDQWVTANSVHVVKSLPVGNSYTLKENATPYGYLKADDISFVVGNSNQTISMVDYKPTGIINLTKSLDRDDSSGANVAGAEYALYSSEGKIIETKSTDKNGKLTFSNLPLGNYYIQETKAPNYTSLDESRYNVSLVYKDQSTSVITYNLNTVNDILVRDISFAKVDSSGNLISGATMQLLTANGDLVEEWISSTDPHVVNDLPVGNSYTLKETVAPEGYVLSDDQISFVVSDGMDEQDVIMTDNQIGVSKENGDGTRISGASLQVIDSNGTVVDEWVSTDQIHYVSGLIVGNDYALHEVLAPEGYLSCEDIEFSVEDNDNIISMTDEQPTGIINLTKSLDRDDSEKAGIVGAEYSLFSSNCELIANGITDEDGKLSFNNLVLGDYYIQETKAPDYTNLDENQYDVSLVYEDQDTAVIVHDLETVNDIKVKNLSISKEDVDGKEIPGASMQLTDSNDVVVDQWISTEQSHVINDLPVGNTYTLRELSSPDGYVLSNDVTFILEDDGNVQQEVAMVDQVVSISKTDLTGESEVIGATLQVIDSEGNVIDEWVSDEQSHDVSGLVENNTYILVEKIAPEGYVLSTESIEFSITENKENQNIVMKDNYVAVAKEEPDGKSVSGATLQVIDLEGNVVDEWISSDQAHYVNGLVMGDNYILHEAVVPTGYLQSADMTFAVGKENQDIVMIDDFTKVTVTKYDITNNKELAGTSMQVLDSDGNVVDEWISTSEAHVIKYLEIGQTYTLKEVIAPIGYTIAQEVEFTVSATGVEQQIKMFDELLPMAVIRTGDDSPVFLYAGLSVVSVIVLLAVAKKRSKGDS